MNVKSRPKSGVKINNLKLKMPTAADVPKIPKGQELWQISIKNLLHKKNQKFLTIKNEKH